jgi:hypothetical protein
LALPVKTDVQIADAALVEVGAIGANERPTAADRATALGAYQSLYDLMLGEGRIGFAIDAVPSWAQRPLVKLIARDIAINFGVTAERYQALINDAKQANYRFNSGASSSELYAPVKVDYE